MKVSSVVGHSSHINLIVHLKNAIVLSCPGKLAWELLERTSHASSRQHTIEVEAVTEAMLAEVAGDMELDSLALARAEIEGLGAHEKEEGMGQEDEVVDHEEGHEGAETELVPVVVEAEAAMAV